MRCPRLYHTPHAQGTLCALVVPFLLRDLIAWFGADGGVLCTVCVLTDRPTPRGSVVEVAIRNQALQFRLFAAGVAVGDWVVIRNCFASSKEGTTGIGCVGMWVRVQFCLLVSASVPPPASTAVLIVLMSWHSPCDMLVCLEASILKLPSTEFRDVTQLLTYAAPGT